MHPTREKLIHFICGTLLEGESSRIEQHLSGCDECVDALERVDLSGDALVSALRKARPHTSAISKDAADENAGGQSGLETVVQPASALASERFGDQETLGRYHLVGELGRGGMGVVYKAFDPALRRFVAIKVVAPFRPMSDEDRARFRSEAEAAARLQHAHIIQIFEFDAQGETMYCALEYVEGGSLDQKLRQAPLSQREAAGLTATLADAVEYAHQRNVVHRDLKPANVLLASDGTPKIADFGLAKILDDDAGYTTDGAIMGSPSYMAPEQAYGDLASIGPGTDVYALGAILYELLAGRPPFREESVLATLEKLKHTDPTLPRSLQRDVSQDLQTICLKCLAKAPESRYHRASDLADDLTRWLDGKPIRARRANIFERTQKLARRHPVAALLIAVLLATAFVGVYAVSFYEQELTKVDAELGRSFGEAQRGGYAVQLQRAASLARSHPTQALRLLEDDEACPPRLRDFCWLHLHRECSIELGRWTAANGVASMESSRAALRFATASANGRIEIWDSGGVEPMQGFRTGQERRAVFGLAADGAKLASLRADYAIELRAIADQWRPLNVTLSLDGVDIGSGAFSPGLEFLVAAEGDGQVHVWSAETGELVRELERHTGGVRRVMYSPDGRYVASLGADPLLRVWRVADWSSNETPSALDVDIESVAFDPASPGRLATAGGDRVVRFWRLTPDGGVRRDGEACQVPSPLGALDFSGDGGLVAAGGWDGVTYVIDAKRRQNRLSLQSGKSRVTAVAFLNDGTLLTATSSGHVVRWSVDRDSAPLQLDGHKQAVTGLAFLHGGRALATTSYDGSVRVWSTQTGTLLSAWEGEGEWITGLSRTANRQELVWEAGGAIYESKSVGGGRLEADVIGPPVAHSNAAMLVGDNLIVSDLQGLRAIGMPSGESRWQLADQKVRLISASGDGRSIAIVGEEPRVTILDADRGSVLSDFGLKVDVSAVALSQTGERLAAGGVGGTIAVFETASGESLGTSAGHSRPVRCLAFSPDGHTLATVAGDREVRLWDAEYGFERLTLSSESTVTVVAFSPDSKALAAGGDNGEAWLWSSREDPPK